ncbi:MAG TPA: hypothetical protein VIY26_05240 [Acidimicrobiales bacterium]
MIDDEAAEHAAGVSARLGVASEGAFGAAATGVAPMLVHAAPSASIATVSLRTTAAS